MDKNEVEELRKWADDPQIVDTTLRPLLIHAADDIDGSRAGDADILAWAGRHEFHGSHIELRCAFEDAQSFSNE